MKIDFRMESVVNDEKFEMNGSGEGNTATGECYLDLTAYPRFPKGFDPVSCPSICSHPTSSFFSKCVEDIRGLPDVARGAYRVKPARIGVISDDDGNELLRLSVTSDVRLVDGVLQSNHNMVGVSKLPQLSHNEVPITDFIVPSGPGRATATVRFALITFSGDRLDGMTICPYAWDNREELTNPLARTVSRLDVKWDGRQRVQAYYETTIQPLSVISEIQSPSHIVANHRTREKLGLSL